METAVVQLPEVICPGCGDRGSVTRFFRGETETVRGVAVPVVKVLRACGACGAEYENSRDPDWRPDAYAKAAIVSAKQD